MPKKIWLGMWSHYANENKMTTEIIRFGFDSIRDSLKVYGTSLDLEKKLGIGALKFLTGAHLLEIIETRNYNQTLTRPSNK